MKRWQIEQILSLNDFGKRKLAMPDSPNASLQTIHAGRAKRENVVLASLRKFFSFFLKVL